MKNTDMREINIDQLGSVSGGYLYLVTYRYSPVAIEVIDDTTGDVVERFSTADEFDAKICARDHGLSMDYISWDQLRMMRVKGPKIGELPEIKGPQIGNPPMGQ